MVMNESYKELLVKKERDMKQTLLRFPGPEKSHQLDSYRNREVKTADYSAGKDLPDQKLYVIYSEGSKKYLLNLTEDFAKTVMNIIPRKVFLQ